MEEANKDNTVEESVKGATVIRLYINHPTSSLFSRAMGLRRFVSFQAEDYYMRLCNAKPEVKLSDECIGIKLRRVGTDVNGEYCTGSMCSQIGHCNISGTV